MSRYTMPANDDKFYVVVGYDNPLQTFFAHVYDKEAENYNNSVDWSATPDAEEKQELIFEVVRRTGQVPDISSLERAVEKYATIPDDIKFMLQKDKENSPGPNNFQRRMIKLIEGLME